MGITEKKNQNKSIKNVGGSCASVMVGFLFDPRIIHIAGVI